MQFILKSLKEILDTVGSICSIIIIIMVINVFYNVVSWCFLIMSGLAGQLKTVGDNTESAFGYGVAGRVKKFRKDDIRSSIFYDNITTDLSDRDRSHWGVNIFKNYTKELSFGFELGNFEMTEQDADSDYVQP